MIRRGEFASDGYFAASNSFPLNTKILVKNLYNGQTTEVIVIQRLSEYYSVFLLLSEGAARELGMGEDDVINVEVIVLNFGTGDTIGLPDDLPYNPDPDVFPLPTIPEDAMDTTPSPGPYPTQTPEPVDTTPGITEEPTPGTTAEPMITGEPTPEPSVEPSPTPGETELTTPEPTPELTDVPTLEPTPISFEDITARDPQKNLFVPPHEGTLYVVDESIKPEETIPPEEEYTLEVVPIDPYDGIAMDGSISPPDHEEDDNEISSLPLDKPDVEDPAIETVIKPDPMMTDIDLTTTVEPVVVEKEKPLPDPSHELPVREEYDITLDPGEPVIPDQEGPEITYEFPEPGEYDTIPDPVEPDVIAKEGDIPDPSHETPLATEDTEIALEPEEPEPPSDADRGLPDPSYDMPDATEDTEIALEPEEPEPPSDADRGLPDPSYEMPDAAEDVEIAMDPADPEPPTDADRGVPDPSNEVPVQVEDVEIAMDPADPEPPTDADRGVPDPSHEIPEHEEEPEIAYNPVDPEPPKDEEIEKDDTVPDDIHEPVEGEEEIIITFVETGPKPPPEEDDTIYELDEVADVEIKGLENGKYFIQLAAYTEKTPALALEQKFKNLYPVNVYPVTDRMLEIYKVLVGPLNKYESDTLLYQFKALGYKDAFVKYTGK